MRLFRSLPTTGSVYRQPVGDVRSGLRGKGPIDIAGLVEQLAADPKVDSVALGKIFGSKEGLKAFTTLIEQTRKAQAATSATFRPPSTRSTTRRRNSGG